MTTEDAFMAGLAAVRAAGLPASGNDVQVIAAHRVFTQRAEPMEDDPRFDHDAPIFAKRVILEAYAAGGAA